MSRVLFWFRADLRLHDQPALRAACVGDTECLLPVYCHPDPAQASAWGFSRVSAKRRAWIAAALRDLREKLANLGCPLLECQGDPAIVLPALARAMKATRVVCEEIAAPQEHAQVLALRAAGLAVHTVWQSSLLEPAGLPWPCDALPGVFTVFRRAVENARLQPPAPLPPPTRLPPWPPGLQIPSGVRHAPAACDSLPLLADSRSSFPRGEAGFDGGESAALAHLARYLERQLPHSYKRTRNGLSGVDYSSKWSPWLATGALSARRILAELREFEAAHGANDGSYWLWFELLWRDYFRFLHLQYGRALYRARSLSDRAVEAGDATGFARWCEARTGEPLIDAGMRELIATGYVGNRLRQILASYLIYDLHGDWRAGAAWFEAHLLDYDVYSNQGNWLYIAGRGTDPRGGRHFDVRKQCREHDPHGAYQRMWSAA